MPPKRKAPRPSRAASTPSGDAVEQEAEGSRTPSNLKTTKDALPSDRWTDEQETSLFKGMIRWKPAGMHKHFRMIAISENLRNHGYTSPQDDHTRIPGIWKKLDNLYNLEALDEREDGFGYAIHNDPAEEPFCDFILPDEDYRDMTFARRLEAEGTSSPPSLPYQLTGGLGRAARRHSTVEDTDDPRSSPASNRGQRSTRAPRGTRTSLLAEQSRPGRGRRGSRVSVEHSVDGDQKEDEEEDNEDVMDVDEDASRETGKASKAAVGKSSTRKSGRKR